MKKEKRVVLVADDQPMNQKLFSMILDNLGIDSILAFDGEDALEKALSCEFELVFMDIQMPKMNGYVASKNLRDRGFIKPIIAVTAGNLLEEKANCLEAGIDDVMIKPINRSGIEKMLEKWIDTSQDVRGDFATPHAEDTIIPASASVVFDIKGMLESFMNDEEAALTYLSRFVERTSLQLEKPPAIKETGDWEKARREAHTIRGAAFTMGGMELGSEAAKLELACINASGKEMDTAYPLVRKAFLRFKKEAEDYVRSRN